MIKLIVATSKNRIIGNDNKLIWKLSSDLKRFKQLTIENNVVMGRKTFESIGKPLPNRRNIILTKNTNYEVDGCDVVSSLEEAFLLTNNNCFVIGGGEIYKQSIQVADKIYLTLIDCELQGDTYFPEIDNSWRQVTREDYKSDEKNQYNYSFLEYERYEF